MFEKNNQIEQIENVMVDNKLFERFNLSRVGVFGSAARGEQSNDIDILIEDNTDYRLLSAFRDELQKLMGKRIDIVIAKYANPIVLHRAMKEIVYVTRH
ncbi:MAG: nucleotidyltransferase domain-containing protein [Eubacteriales bacterium]|jgi:predicted nucleotidyltransferase|nr:nucleotidyltransferase domain-containing protein [Eubacteriales bacterium]